jgi:HlyD family secretion protein
MIRQYLFVTFWVVILILLLIFSTVSTDTNKAIVAQVEPTKRAVSYHKAVRVLEIYAIPGQKVSPGDMLVKVERPDLILDVERKHYQLERIRIEKNIASKKFEDKQKLLSLEKDAKIRKIETEKAQLEVIVSNNQQLSNRFGKLTGFADTMAIYGDSYYEIDLEAMDEEMEHVLQEYWQNKDISARIFEQEMKSLEIEELEIEQELQALIDEEEQLIKRAEVAGTIGSISAQPGELLSPYSTILSIYDLNPTVIKAFMNEGFKYPAEVGQRVTVESTNRKYKIEGQIFEVGSRIIEYPNRLKANERLAMYGQELFIKIPSGNNFLNGERVFVTINE